MTLLRTFWDAALAVDPASGTRDEGTMMRYATPDELAAAVAPAGLERITSAPP